MCGFPVTSFLKTHIYSFSGFSAYTFTWIFSRNVYTLFCGVGAPTVTWILSRHVHTLSLGSVLLLLPEISQDTYKSFFFFFSGLMLHCHLNSPTFYPFCWLSALSVTWILKKCERKPHTCPICTLHSHSQNPYSPSLLPLCHHWVSPKFSAVTDWFQNCQFVSSFVDCKRSIITQISNTVHLRYITFKIHYFHFITLKLSSSIKIKKRTKKLLNLNIGVHVVELKLCLKEVTFL